MAGRKRILTGEKLERALREYPTAENIDKLAYELGVTAIQLIGTCNKAGVHRELPGRWTLRQLQTLKDRYEKAMDLKALSRDLDKTLPAIHTMARSLGLRHKSRHKSSKEM